MPDIQTVIASLRADDQFNEASNLPEVQFRGPRNRRYLGAELLPESPRPANQYDEEDFHVLDLVASDVDAYSPPPFKGSFARVSSFNVRMGDSGLALQMATNLYSSIVGLLGRSASMDRVAAEILSFNGVILSAMLTHNERQRWRAIEAGRVVRIVNQTAENIDYPNNPGQRSSLVGVWSDPAYDPWPDLFAQNTRARSLGFPGVRRIITSQRAVDILQNNPNTQRRVGQVQVIGSREYADYADRSQLNAYTGVNGLPIIETFDETWRDQGSSGRFLSENVMVFVYDTGRTVEDLVGADLNADFVPDNLGAGLGYTGIGTTAGHEDRGPGRFQNLAYNDGARPNVMGEGVQKGLPVFTEPAGFAVYTNIR